MSDTANFSAHLEQVLDAIGGALRGGEAEGVLFHAGTQFNYHADDHPIPFHTVPHFARIAPIAGPDHLILCRPGQRPRLTLVVPRGYWYEAPRYPDSSVLSCFEVDEVGSAEALAERVVGLDRCAYVGNDPALAEKLGIAASLRQPSWLLSRLDWQRAYKTDYEVESIRAAAELAAKGHAAVRGGFSEGLSERRLHALYLEACGILEPDSPYGNIIAWNRNAAILHYESKETEAPAEARVLLIDAGAAVRGYASDITRTYAAPGAHPVFREAVDRMDRLERALVEAVRPGQSFVELHRASHRGVTEILCDLGVLTVGVDEALEQKLSLQFFPHGLGHHLGIQVHDVGGHQVDPEGGTVDPPEDYPSLRTTRPLEVGHVVTIEPGLYFIPMLLDPLRDSDAAAAVNWKLVEELAPCGGIRIEDDVVVTEAGAEDLTRSLIPGHLDATPA